MLPAAISPELELLADDCRAIVVEGEFSARWTLLETYHKLGERIVNDGHFVWNARGNGATLNHLSKLTGISERRLYHSIQFYTKWPNLDELPFGKNISWSKVVALLPDGKEHSPVTLPMLWPKFANYIDRLLEFEELPQKVRALLRQIQEEMK